VARESIFTIDKFLGVNESPDGDTGLQFGEAAIMRNFHITKEGNLQKRPGWKSIFRAPDTTPVRCIWHGNVSGVEHVVVASAGKLFDMRLSDFGG